MKGSGPEAMLSVGMIIIGAIGLIAILYAINPAEAPVTKAFRLANSMGSSITALSTLGEGEGGRITIELGGEFDVEIGLRPESGVFGPPEPSDFYSIIFTPHTGDEIGESKSAIIGAYPRSGKFSKKFIQPEIICVEKKPGDAVAEVVLCD